MFFKVTNKKLHTKQWKGVLKGSPAFMQHFKFVNFVFWCHEQVIYLYSKLHDLLIKCFHESWIYEFSSQKFLFEIRIHKKILKKQFDMTKKDTLQCNIFKMKKTNKEKKYENMWYARYKSINHVKWIGKTFSGILWWRHKTYNVT